LLSGRPDKQSPERGAAEGWAVATDLRDIRLPTVAGYVTAFRAIEPEITEKQHELSRVHHASSARTISATETFQAGAGSVR